MKKFNKKYAGFLSSAIMSVLMAFIMTGIVTAINFKGFPSNYLELWMTAFSTMVFVAFGVIMVVKPLVEKIIKKIVE